ncbi:uncharacterized protein K460DRAFT_111668 [Cucurbitaria berberidis CBS 394.84]|uniref:Uncharacterized protein n=1 Tax=Cucurbitaria berberidis CBS 394.84 TaxID=1168544 RepID=A0A9P4L8W6_9PLEO|nr:uncharacterized protein K460DRAFT_111668 [Cucurbitaria berberidis CBS 394.84]KAF1845614.1 hypothetical protein K460DRAFT_111668 [Cucurbitaria berberidis CBS 394.84]
MSFGFSPSDVIKLLEVSTRVYIAFKDANENSEAQVEALVREFTTFHQCLTELDELMKEYGKPLPFPCKDFEVTLEKCERSLEPYAENLVDKKMGIRKFLYTIKYMGKEKEIEGLRKQISGHYQALHMCISFLQLRLHLDATKQTQRLLDAPPFRAMSLGGRSYTNNALGSSSQGTPLALPAPDEHPLYSEWRIFDRWLQSEDDRVAQEAGLTRPLSLGDTPAAAPSGDVETAAILYHLRRQVDDAILIEENRVKRTTAEKRSHLAPSDAMKQKVRGMPPAPQRTYTLDTEHSGNFSGFEQHHMSSSSTTIRPGSSTPLSPVPPSGSPRIESSYFSSMDWAQSPTDTTITHDIGNNRSSVSTTRSSFSNSPDSRLSVSGLGLSTAGTTPESALSRPLRHRLSVTSLATIALGEGAMEWNSLCRKVQVERQSAEHVHGRERIVVETKECDVHWRYREDTGISLRTLYRSSKDNKPRPWTMQHFPATGPSIPLTTTYADGEVSVDFPRGSFGKLDKHWTEIKYTFNGYDSAEKFQTLLYTNNGTDSAELKYDRPILSISSNKNSPECRGRNLRLWRRSETHLEQNGPVTFNALVLLFYTSALDKGHWVEEPHYAFEWLADSIFKKDSDKLTLVFSKDPAKWTSDKLFQRRKSSNSSVASNPATPRSPTFSRKRNDSMEIPGMARSGTDVSVASSAISITSRSVFGRSNGSVSSRAGNLNRFGYSELDIKFQNREDRRAFLDVWKEYVKPLGANATTSCG